MTRAGTCPDCERPAVAAPGGEAPRYCVRCGQRLDVRALGLGEIVSEALGSLFTLELPILRTTRDLLVQPGRVADAWIAGKRRTYINPLKFVVIIGVVVALLYEPLHQLREAQSAPGQALYRDGLANLSSQFLALVFVVLLVPIALVLRWLGPRFRVERRWLDWYVLGLYTYGLACVLQLLLLVIDLALPRGATVQVVLWQVRRVLPILLLMWGAYGFVERGARWRGVFLAFVAQVVAFVAIILVAGGLELLRSK